MNSGRGGCREGAGRKHAWKHGETQTIRVPKALVSQLLEIARKLDEGEAIDFVTQPKRKFNSVTKSKPTHVESVTNSDGMLQSLTCKALARRLGVDPKAIRDHRDGVSRVGLTEWTRDKDPEGVAWEYSEQAKMYYPMN